MLVSLGEGLFLELI